MIKTREDILDCAGQLQDALDDPALEEFDQPGEPSASARHAACRLAVALGYCRLFGVRLPEGLDGTLTAAQALGAAESLRGQMEEWIAGAQTLGKRWDEAEPEEAEALCADTLEQLMDAWAGLVAIGEASHAALEDNDPAHEAVYQAVLGLLETTEALDRALQTKENAELLSMAAGSALLENWRRLLVEPYALWLPWWLDGTLEEIDRRIAADERAYAEATRGGRLSPGQSRELAAARSERWDEVVRSLPAPILMAAQPAEGTGAAWPFAAVARWRSPDGRYVADLPIPSRPVEGEVLYLKVVRDADQQEAGELQGEPVRLAGIERSLDERGRAAFRLDELLARLRADQRDVSLAVGDNRELWEELADCLERGRGSEP